MFDVEWGGYLGDLATAALRTVQYALVGALAAVVIAGALALMRTSPVRILRYAGATYVEALKNLPLLTWLFILYYGLPSIGITMTAFVAGSIALATYYGAYISEIFRAALNGVHKGQREAALAVGLTGSRTIRKVVLPAALRLALPGTATMLVDLLKGTSLLVSIAGAELMTTGQVISSMTFEPLEVFLVIGAIYFAICFPLSRAILRLESKLRDGDPLSRSRRRLFREVRAYAEVARP